MKKTINKLTNYDDADDLQKSLDLEINDNSVEIYYAKESAEIECVKISHEAFEQIVAYFEQYKKNQQLCEEFFVESKQLLNSLLKR